MKNKLLNIALVLICFALAGCQDNGYIGIYYGTWRVEKYTIDGEKQSNELIDNTTVSFQNATVVIQTVIDSYMSADTRYGTWKEDGDIFTLNFTHHDNSINVGEHPYAAPFWLGMTSVEPMIMHKTTYNKKRFSLTWTDSEGHIKVYTLAKIY